MKIDVILCENVSEQFAASIFRVVEKNKVCAINGKSGLGNWCSELAGEMVLWSRFGCEVQTGNGFVE
jgi:hypothetical protein